MMPLPSRRLRLTRAPPRAPPDVPHAVPGEDGNRHISLRTAARFVTHSIESYERNRHPASHPLADKDAPVAIHPGTTLNPATGSLVAHMHDWTGLLLELHRMKSARDAATAERDRLVGLLDRLQKDHELTLMAADEERASALRQQAEVITSAAMGTLAQQQLAMQQAVQAALDAANSQQRRIEAPNSQQRRIEAPNSQLRRIEAPPPPPSPPLPLAR